MATTSTFTATSTFARIELLKLQVRIALKRTVDVTPDILERTVNTGLDLRWIGSIHVYAVDKSNLCHAQLTLEIDWDKHDLEVSKGKVTVTVDNKLWCSDTAVELSEVLDLFARYAKDHSLTTRWSCYKPNSVTVDHKEWLKTLHLVDGDAIKWLPGSRAEYSQQIPELTELRVGCYLVDE